MIAPPKHATANIAESRWRNVKRWTAALHYIVELFQTLLSAFLQTAQLELSRTTSVDEIHRSLYINIFNTPQTAQMFFLMRTRLHLKMAANIAGTSTSDKGANQRSLRRRRCALLRFLHCLITQKTKRCVLRWTLGPWLVTKQQLKEDGAHRFTPKSRNLSFYYKTR